MSSRQKIKGYKLEHFCVKDLRAAGLNCQRLGQAYQSDLMVDGFGLGECKVRASGLKSIYDWLGEENDFLVIHWKSTKARGKEPLVVVRWSDFKQMLKSHIGD